ncbi:MAG: thioredoxin domain-containing protein [Anaerolineales bacterium]|nr:thioredoxin domain-containing protein [Anaerolineales bacterium]
MWAIIKENLVKYAKALDLNMAEFESCLSEEKHKGTVEQDAAAAEANGIHATPTFFINGFKVEGAQPYSILKDLIEQALDGNLDTQNG